MYNKGFTLVEAAIALVVIGLIIGAGIGMQAIIGAAKVRSDISKIRKFETATALYFAENQAIPYDEGSSACTFNYRKAYSKYVTDKDYVLSTVGKTYFAVGRTRFSDTTERYFNGGPCGRITVDPMIIITTGSTTNYETASTYFPRKLACYIEVILDDSDLANGKGRAVDDNREQLDKITSENFKDCSNFAENVRNGFDRSGANTTLRYSYQLFILD